MDSDSEITPMPPALLAATAIAPKAADPAIERPFGFVHALSGPTRGARVPIFDRLLIGRGARCDLLLPGEEVSRSHVQLVVGNRGRVVLIDLNSTNGVTMNGEEVLCRMLEPGDLFAIQGSVFAFEGVGSNEVKPERPDPDRPLIADIMRYRALMLRSTRGEGLSGPGRERAAELDLRLRPSSAAAAGDRRFRRFLCSSTVEVHTEDGETLTAPLHDISAEGAGLLHLAVTLSRGDHVQLVFGSPEDSERYCVAAVVRWSQGRRVGLAFAASAAWYPRQASGAQATVPLDPAPSKSIVH